MAVIAGFKPKSERLGQTVKYPGAKPEDEDMSINEADLRVAMKQFIAAIKSGKVEIAIQAYKDLHDLTDQVLESEESEEE